MADFLGSMPLGCWRDLRRNHCDCHRARVRGYAGNVHQPRPAKTEGLIRGTRQDLFLLWRMADEKVLLIHRRWDGDVKEAHHHLVSGLISPTNGLAGIWIVRVVG